MRFLLGLIAGAAVVLAVAAGLSGEGDWRSRLTALAEQVQGLMAAAAPASTDVELAAVPEPEPQTILKPEPQTILKPEPQTILTPEPQALPQAQPAAPEADLAEPARSPIPRPPDPRPVDTPALEAALQESEPLPQGDFAAPQSPVPQPPVPPAAPESGGPGLQTVWVPFHSEMSASGFADRLSERLDHPFRVERRGPGRYQVVFGYDDEPERQSLLAEASRVTGLTL